MELTGIPASPGSATGPVYVVAEQPAPAAVTAAGMDGVREAMALAAARLEELAAGVRDLHPRGADVLEAQALLARDEAVEPAIQDGLRDGMDPVTAVREAYAEQAAQLEALGGDSYIGARALDVCEAGRAIVDILTGDAFARLAGLTFPAVVVAHDLAPADTLAVLPELLVGIVTETGGATSHAAIVARELGVPAVLGVEGAVAAAATARSALVDGDRGRVRFSTAEVGVAGREVESAPSPVQVWLPLLGNAGSAHAVVAAARHGAQGIGLLRTELLYLGRSAAPTEEEQLALLREACTAIAPHPVTVRTLDAGSDKALPYLTQASEPNPALGSRGVRLWLGQPLLAAAQARAILRAGAEHPNLRVMIPMVSAREEVDGARAVFKREGEGLGLPEPSIGIMIETPAAAMSLPTFEGAVEFISVGTNDLAQYAAAADRDLSWGDDLGEWNPGTLRLMQRALVDARRLGIDAAVCGELAGSPAGAVLLAGLGATSLSMSAASLEAVARALRDLGPEGCTDAAQEALGESTAGAARAAVERRLPR